MEIREFARKLRDAVMDAGSDATDDDWMATRIISEGGVPTVVITTNKGEEFAVSCRKL